jgi:tetratricopeptide (TPR) repeat protein
VLSSQTDPFLWNSNQPAWDLIDWAENTLRAGPPQPAERQWYLCAIALFERADVAKELDQFVARALGRSPKEERWALVRGVAQDLNTWPSLRDRNFSPDPSISSLITSRYQEAAALPSVRQEALLRLGYFELRRGRLDEALARFKDVGQPQDRFLRYWLGLLWGRALEQAGKIDDAIASYEDAFNAVPFARSVTVALSAALVQAHREPDARRLAARMLVTPAPPDPWAVYVLPDYRFWEAAMDVLRKAVAE